MDPANKVSQHTLQSARERTRQGDVDTANEKLRAQRRLEQRDEGPVFLQLHYMKSYDKAGYPEMRQDFVEYLEESLDRHNQQRESRYYRHVAYWRRAEVVVEADQPALYAYYNLRDRQGLTYREIADLTGTRQSVATRYVLQMRRAVRYWYDKALREAGLPVPPG